MINFLGIDFLLLQRLTGFIAVVQSHTSLNGDKDICLQIDGQFDSLFFNISRIKNKFIRNEDIDS